jgi:hypothetical protein
MIDFTKIMCKVSPRKRIVSMVKFNGFMGVKANLKLQDYSVSRWCREKGFSRDTVKILISGKWQPKTYPPQSPEARRIYDALKEQGVL